MFPFEFSHPRSLEKLQSRSRTKKHCVVVAAFLVLFGLGYLFAANAIVAASYRLSDTVAAQSRLARDIESLRSQISAASDPGMIEQKAAALGFAPVKSPSYLAVPGTTVAQR